MNERKQKFAEVIMALAAIHDKEVDKATLQGYWLALGELEIERLQEAATVAARTLKFFPKPAELLELAGGESVEDRAKLAWVEVSKAAKSSSWPKDPLAAEAVRHMGGPRRLGQMKTDEFEVWGRKQFEEIYASLSVRVRREGLPPHPETEALPEGKVKQLVAETAAKIGS